MSATSRAGRAMAGGATRRRLLGVSPRTLAARHAQAIERALDLGDQPGRNAGVAGRRLQLLVSEQRLNHANVRAALKQMGCEAVAKRMQRERFTQPRCFRCLLEQPCELACRQRPTFTATGKQPALFRREAGVIRGRPRLPPLPQQVEDLCRQHHVPVPRFREGRLLRPFDCTTRMIICSLSMSPARSRTTSPARSPQP
jgi:hypothetical protein